MPATDPNPPPLPRPASRDEVFAVVRDCVLRTLPHLTADQVTPSGNLRELGADSLDRLDIATSAQAELGIRTSAEGFAGITDLAGLLDALWTHSGPR